MVVLLEETGWRGGEEEEGVWLWWEVSRYLYGQGSWQQQPVQNFLCATQGPPRLVVASRHPPGQCCPLFSLLPPKQQRRHSTGTGFDPLLSWRRADCAPPVAPGQNVLNWHATRLPSAPPSPPIFFSFPNHSLFF